MKTLLSFAAACRRKLVPFVPYAAAVAVAAVLLGPAFFPPAARTGLLPLSAAAASDTPARAQLLALAANLPTSPSETFPDVQRLCFDQWSLDTTSPAGTTAAHRVQQLRNRDGSGHETVNGTRQDFAAGTWPQLIRDGDPATDPAVLHVQLARHESPANGPHVTARAVADLHFSYQLTAAQRRAALLVLAGSEPVRYRGTAEDRHGRAVHAFTADSNPGKGGQTRDLLLIDDTGRVLEHDVSVLTQAPRSPAGPGTVVAYMLHC